jgi:hypothetical protein
VGQVVATSFTCADASGPGLTSCDDSNGVNTSSGGAGALDTSTPGLHTYTVTAISSDHLAGTGSISYTVIGKPTALAQPASGGTYAVGQVVPTTFSCTEASGGPGLSSCDDSNGVNTSSGGAGDLDTFTVGPHTYTVTASSSDGLINTTTISYSVMHPPTAQALPAPGGTYTLGQVVPTTFSCSEGLGSPGLASCNDSHGTGTASGGSGTLDTSTAGAHGYTVTATSTDGLTGTATISYMVIGPPTARVGSPPSGGTYAIGQVVPTSFTCAEASGGPGLSSCDDSNGSSTTSGGSGHLDTSTPGAVTYTVTATSKNGLAGTTSISYTVTGPPTERISSPPSGRTFERGQVVPTSFRCADASGGPGLASCDDSNGKSTASGGTGALNTSTPGAHTYTVTATSTNGLTSSTSIQYRVTNPRVSIKTTRVSVASRTTKVAVGCSGATVCAGKLTLTGKSGKHAVVLATARYSVSDRAGGSIVLTLSRAALTLLTKAPHHRMPVQATATLTGGPTANGSIVLTLRSPPKHH